MNAEFQNKTFRPAIWISVANTFMLLPVLGMLVITTLFGWNIFTVFGQESLGLFGLFMLVIFLPMSFFLFLPQLFLLISLIGSLAGTYIKVLPTGLEYRIWPFYWIRCKWEDIERRVLYFSFGPIRSEVLRLRNFETLGSQAMTSFRKRLRLKPTNIVPLSSISGYPKGEYMDVLRKMIPEVMSEAQGDYKRS